MISVVEPVAGLVLADADPDGDAGGVVELYAAALGHQAQRPQEAGGVAGGTTVPVDPSPPPPILRWAGVSRVFRPRTSRGRHGHLGNG